MGDYEFRTRLNTLLAHYPEGAKDNFYWICLQNFNMRHKRNLAKLKNELAIVRPKLLIIDNHASFHGGNPNDEGEMMVNVISPFREIMAEFDLGILYLMHTPWSEKDRPRGSVVIFDAASTTVAIIKPQSDLRELKWTKRRPVRRNMGALEIEIGYNDQNYLVYQTTQEVIEQVLSEISFPCKRGRIAHQIADSMGIHIRNAYKWVDKLIARGRLIKLDTGEISEPTISF
jgi:hypothetical protein